MEDTTTKQRKKSKAIAALSKNHLFGDNGFMPGLMSTLHAIKNSTRCDKKVKGEVIKNHY